MYSTSKKRVAFDMLLNIVATIIPIVVLQLYIFPSAAVKLGDENYGLMITMISLMSLVSFSLGNVLNNVRLLRQNEYAEIKQSGDFNILLIYGCICNATVIIIGTIKYCGLSPTSITFSLLAATLLLMRTYLTVYFRIELNYFKVLIDNLILIAGYFIGFLLFRLSAVWQLIFIFGNLFSIIFILTQKNLLGEPIKRTTLFQSTLKESAIYTVATLCAAALGYVDKIMLYPMLGGAMVSVYYSATIMGKICSMAISPISSVMLSYLSKMKKFKRKSFFTLLLLITVICCVGFFICILISGPILNWLYPNWAAQSMQIIYITTASAMLSLICSVLNPIVLRFCKMNWQVIINAVSLVIYIIACLILVKHYALPGFAIGVLISYICELILIVLIFLLSYNTNIDKFDNNGGNNYETTNT